MNHNRSRVALVLPASIFLNLNCALLSEKQKEFPPKKPEASESEAKRVSSTTESQAKDLLQNANNDSLKGNFREAIAGFQQYLKLNPNDPGAHRTIGIIYVRTGAFKKGIEHLEKASDFYSQDFELNYYIGEAYRTQARYADAIFHYRQALRKQKDNIPTLKAIAWSYYTIRYYSEALKTVYQLRKIDQKDIQISLIYARILNRTGWNEKALNVLNLAETNAKAEELPYLWSARGDILLDLEDRKSAEQFYRKALQEQPLLPGSLTGLARCLMSNPKNSSQAQELLERAIRIKPNQLDAALLLARILEESDPVRSMALYRRFYKDAAYDPSYQAELIKVRQVLNKRDKKLKQKDTTLSTSPETSQEKM